VAKWSGTPVHDLARRFRAQGQLLSIPSIAETAAFRARDEGVTYPEAGSFVRFLIDSEGIAPMRRLLARRGRAALAGVPRFVTHPAPRTLAPALVTSQNQLYALSV